MAETNVADALVGYLSSRGVQHVFGVLAHTSFAIGDAIARRPQMHFVNAQHEGGAGNMALGYARVTKKPAICLVSAGGGATNIVTPVAQAHKESVPLFVISLTTGGHAYFWRFDAVAPDGSSPWDAFAIDVALFSAFALHHSVLARTRLKHALHTRVGIDVERAVYVIVASLLFVACTRLWRPLPGTWYALSGWAWWAGAAVQGTGVLVTLLAARTLSLKELMGLDPSRQASPRDDARPLETRGLYRLVRHPIYFGWLLFVGGAPLMTSTRLLFAVISVTYLMVAIPFEERALVANFGAPYEAYRQRVRWRLVPGLY